MTAATPATGWRALPRKALTAMRLAWRALRRARALPGFLRMAWETSLIPRWSEARGLWTARFSPGALAAALWRGISALAVAKPVLYSTPVPAAEGRRPRPRVLHAIPNLFVGGSTQLIFDILTALGERYDMRVLTSALPPSGRHAGAAISVIPHNASVATATAAIAGFAPQIVHIHYWGDVDQPWYESVLAAAAAIGARVVLNVNTPVAPIASGAIAETVFVSDYVRRTFGAGVAPSRVIHPGIELDRFAPAGADPDAARSIGMVYRLEPDKLRPEAIDILIDVCKARPRTRAVIVGGGSLFAPFAQRVRAAGVRGPFHFTGPVPYASLPGIYRRFAIFVAPVWKESFGQVTPFAMSMGLAVAGNRIGALPEILQSDETLGETPQASAAAIIALLDDPARTASLGARNAAIAHAAYGVQTMTAAYDALYRDILGEAADPMAGFPPALVFAA